MIVIPVSLLLAAAGVAQAAEPAASTPATLPAARSSPGKVGGVEPASVRGHVQGVDGRALVVSERRLSAQDGDDDENSDEG